MDYFKDYNIDRYDKAFDEKRNEWFYPVLIQKFCKNVPIKEKWIYVSEKSYKQERLRNEELLDELIKLPANTKVRIKTSFDIL